MTRYLMVIGIVMLHTPPYQSLAELGMSPFDLLKGFVSHGLFRATVPVLTVLSGYLVFQTGMHLQFARLLKKKVQTLLLPLLIWNIPLVVAVYVVQRYGLIDYAFSTQLYPFDPGRWLDATLGLRQDPVNYPLNFLRDLFVVSLAAPLFHFLISRAPYLGLVVVLVVYYFNLDGDLVLRNSMIVNFYMGGLVAMRGWDLRALDRFAWPFLLLTIVFCVAIVIFDIENREWFRLIAPVLIWPAMSLIARGRFAELVYRHSRVSFLTFLSQGPILMVLWLGYQNVAAVIPYPVFWISAPVIVVLTSIIGYPIFRRIAPGLARVALGGR